MRAFLPCLLIVVGGLLATGMVAPAEEDRAQETLPPANELPQLKIPGTLVPGTPSPKGKLTQLPGEALDPLPPPPPSPFGGTPTVIPVPSVTPPLIAPPALPGTGPGLHCPIVDPPAPVVLLKIRVLACSPATAQIHYRICIENTALAPAHHVVVRNPLPTNAKFVSAQPQPAAMTPELVWNFGTLPGCACRDIDLVLEPTDDQDVKNCARVQFEHGQCVITRIAKGGAKPFMPPAETPGGKKPDGKKPPVGPPPPVTTGKLQLEVEGPDSQKLNLPATYTITLKNTGDGTASNAMIACDLPKTAEFVEASKGGQFLAGHVAWLVGNLKPGEDRTVTLTWKGKSAGKICLQPFAIADPHLQATTQKCTVFLQPGPGIGLEMVDTKDPVAVGEETSYVIQVLSQGQVPVTNVSIKTVLPKELKFVKATAPVDFQEALTPDGDQMILFKSIKKLDSAAEAKYEVFVRALKPGDVRFKVELIADHLKGVGPVTETEGTVIYADDGPVAPVLLEGTVTPVKTTP